MKKYIHLLATFLLVLTISCTSNEAINVPVSENDLLGEWNVSTFSADQGNATAFSNGLSITGTFSAYGSSINMITTFEENPNTVSAEGSLIANSEVSFLGQNYYNEEEVNNIPGFLFPANWSLTENVLTFTNLNQTVAADIIYFSTDTLRLKTALGRNLTELVGTDITQQIDLLIGNTIAIDSVIVNTDLFLTLTR
jgi:hypothetical protein